MAYDSSTKRNSSKLNREKGMFFVKSVMLYVLIIIMLSAGVKLWALILGKKLTVELQDQASRAAMLQFKESAANPLKPYNLILMEARAKGQTIADQFFDKSPLAMLSTGNAAPTVTIDFGYWDFTSAPNCTGDCFTKETDESPTFGNQSLINAVRAHVTNETSTQHFIDTHLLSNVVTTRTGHSTATYHSILGVAVASRE